MPNRQAESGRHMTMKFSEHPDRIDVRYVAKLARMALSDDETTLLQGQLEDILAYVDELKQLDLTGVHLTDINSDAQTTWREDEPQVGLSRDAALANAPLARHGQFVVPKVVE